MSLRLAEAPGGSLFPDSLKEWEEDFEVLYRRYFPRLVRMLRRRTNDHAAAEDIAQETLVRTLARLEDLDLSQPLWPWLKTIATNLVIDRARSTGRELPSEDPTGSKETCELEIEEDGPLFQAIASLPQRQQVAVSLRYIDGWKTMEAADFLGMGRPAFEQLLFRARQKLRTEYGRLQESALAPALLPIRWLKRMATRVSQQMRESGGSLGPVGFMGSDAAAQVVSGLLAITTAVAGGMAFGDQHIPAATHRVAASAGRSAQDVVSAGAHRDTAPRSNDPAQVGASDSATADESGRPFTPGGAAKKLTDPNGDVRQPEDTTITSIVSTATGEDDETFYAAGRTSCAATCPSILFSSTDGGSSWERLKGDRFEGDTLAVPPGGDGRTLFSMGSVGLQVSHDGGQSFKLVAPTSSPFLLGSPAVSPAFFTGDPTVLVGSQTLMRYRDDLGTTEPYPAALTGPLNPVYAPQYPQDPIIYVGGTMVRPETNEALSTVHSCNGSICTQVTLEGSRFTPRLRLSDDFVHSGTIAAFVDKQLFVSHDRASSFYEMPIPLEAERIADLAMINPNVLFAATLPNNDDQGGGLLITTDRGAHWTSSNSPLFDHGARFIAAGTDRIVVGLGTSGLACSTDSGATWNPRCD